MRRPGLAIFPIFMTVLLASASRVDGQIQKEWTVLVTQGDAVPGDGLLTYEGNGRILIFTEGSTYQLVGSTWTRWDPPGPDAAPSSAGHIAYDSVRDRIVLLEFPYPDPTRTWEWTPSTVPAQGSWSQTEAEPVPEQVCGVLVPIEFDRDPALVDMEEMTIVAIGGQTVCNGGLGHCEQGCQFQASGGLSEWDGTEWIAGSGFDPPLIQHAVAYDAGHESVVIFGGLTSGTDIPRNDTWTYGSGGLIAKSPTLRPSARSRHAMTYDSASEIVVLAGGTHDPNETWLWDGTDWTRASQCAPAVRPYGLTYDPVNDRVITHVDGLTYQWADNTGSCQRTTYYRDADEDGYGNANSWVECCIQPAGHVPLSTDCNDLISSINPNALELCNSVDDDCDGTSDEGGDALCDDNKLCTDNRCMGSAGCKFPQRDCSDGETCTTDACDPLTGNCLNSIRPRGKASRTFDPAFPDDLARPQIGAQWLAQSFTIRSAGDLVALDVFLVGGSAPEIYLWNLHRVTFQYPDPVPLTGGFMRLSGEHGDGKPFHQRIDIVPEVPVVSGEVFAISLRMEGGSPSSSWLMGACKNCDGMCVPDIYSDGEGFTFDPAWGSWERSFADYWTRAEVCATDTDSDLIPDSIESLVGGGGGISVAGGTVTCAEATDRGGVGICMRDGLGRDYSVTLPPGTGALGADIFLEVSNTHGAPGIEVRNASLELAIPRTKEVTLPLSPTDRLVHIMDDSDAGLGDLGKAQKRELVRIPTPGGCALSDIEGNAIPWQVETSLEGRVTVRGLMSTALGIFPDKDGDLVADYRDNCPSVSNPLQTDTNHDQVGDACQARVEPRDPRRMME